MFVSNNSALIRNRDRNIRVVFQNNALAAKAAFQARIDGAIDKIFFFIGNFLQKVLPFFHINVAGGAGAYAAAVVVEVHVVFFGQFQNRHVGKFARYCFGRNAGIFELKSNCCHVSLILQEGVQR